MPLVDCGFPQAGDNPSPQQLLCAHGPTLYIDVGYDSNFDYANLAVAKATPETPKSTASQVPALVDTGATESCIDNVLAVSLGLPEIDRLTISGVSGHDEVPVYLAHIVVPSLRLTQYGSFAGVKLTDGGQLHQVLIGRTFLQNMIMIYDGLRGQVTLAR